MGYEIAEIAVADNVDIEKIPDAVPRGVFKRITLPRDAKPIFITFDLETTDLSKLLTSYDGCVYIAIYTSTCN